MAGTLRHRLRSHRRLYRLGRVNRLFHHNRSFHRRVVRLGISQLGLGQRVDAGDVGSVCFTAALRSLMHQVTDSLDQCRAILPEQADESRDDVDGVNRSRCLCCASHHLPPNEALIAWIVAFKPANTSCTVALDEGFLKPKFAGSVLLASATIANIAPFQSAAVSPAST